MKCTNCSQFGDWLDEGSNWDRVHEETPTAVHPLLECSQCGNRQTLH